MNILIISPSNTFPALSGGAVRTNALLKYLAKENEIFYVYNKYHQVREVREGKIKSKAKIGNVKIYPVGPTIRVAQLFNALLLMKAHKIIKKQKINLVIGEFAWSGIYLILLKILTNAPYIIDEHNLEFRLVKYNYGVMGRLISPLVKIYEKIIWNFSEYILCVSRDDKRTIRNSGVDNKKIIILPNGINNYINKKINKRKIREKLRLNQELPLILFFGKLDYFPNRKAVYIIHQKILPKLLKINKEIIFLIVGSNPPKLSHKNIVFTGPVDNIEDYINASDLVISPLNHGEGTRIKILDAISCGKKAISTSIGAKGLINEGLKNFLMIQNDWDKFAEEINKNLYKKEIKLPRKFLEKYSWEKNIVKLNLILKQKRIGNS